MKRKVNKNNINYEKIVVEWWKDALLFYQWCIDNEQNCKRETQCSVLDSFYIGLDAITEGRRDLILCNPNGAVRVWLYYNCPFDFVTRIIYNED